VSEFHVVEVGFKDEGVLIQSLKEMGYNPQVHKDAVSLHGYRGDKRKQKAHIVIPRSQVGGMSNDVGFERVKKGFVLHASAFDSPWRKGVKIKQLNKSYSENKLRKTVNSISSYNITDRKELENGKIEIHIRVTN